MAIATFEYADLIGKPFAYGGRGPDHFDCYGLAEELQRRAGRTIPDYKHPQTIEEIAEAVRQNMPVWTPCEPEPGAIAAIRIGRFVSHVATILPFGKMIHTWEKSGGVCVEQLSGWDKRIVGFYKFPQ